MIKGKLVGLFKVIAASVRIVVTSNRSGRLCGTASGIPLQAG